MPNSSCDVKIESNINEGKQSMPAPGCDKLFLKYGMSIIDECFSWEGAVDVLDKLAAAVRTGRTLKR